MKPRMIALMIGMTLALSSTAYAQAGTTQGIAWSENLSESFHAALDRQKPLVVFFYFKGSKHSATLSSEALASKEVNSLKDKAVFVRVDIDQDDSVKNVSKMVEQLGLKTYPVVSVLDVSKEVIKERGRVTGEYSATEFYFELTHILLQPSAQSSAKF